MEKITTSIVIFFVLFCNITLVSADYFTNEQFTMNSSEWQKLSLVLYDTEDNLLMEVQLLRPFCWIEEMDAEVEGYVYLVLPEKGISDRFYVKDIAPYGDISPTDGNLVTGLFRSFGPTVTISFADSDETMECTYGHRFYSIDQSDWIPAQELLVNDRILTVNGSVTISSLVFHDEIKEVFNLEVADEHTYCVTLDNIVSHNQNPCVPITDPRRMLPESITINWLPELDADVKAIRLTDSLTGNADVYVAEKVTSALEYDELVIRKGPTVADMGFVRDLDLPLNVMVDLYSADTSGIRYVTREIVTRAREEMTLRNMNQMDLTFEASRLSLRPNGREMTRVADAYFNALGFERIVEIEGYQKGGPLHEIFERLGREPDIMELNEVYYGITLDYFNTAPDMPIWTH